MFGKKELTPQEQFDKSQKKIDRTLKKRDKLDKKYSQNPYSITDYDDRRKKMNRTIAKEIDNREAAKIQMRHPPKKQSTVNTTINANVNISKTDKSKSLHIHGHYHSSSKKKK